MYQSERQLDELRAIRKRWAESEWRLQFLRSFTDASKTTPTDDQLRSWDQTTKSSCSPWQIPPA